MDLLFGLTPLHLAAIIQSIAPTMMMTIFLFYIPKHLLFPLYVSSLAIMIASPFLPELLETKPLFSNNFRFYLGYAMLWYAMRVGQMIHKPRDFSSMPWMLRVCHLVCATGVDIRMTSPLKSRTFSFPTLLILIRDAILLTICTFAVRRVESTNSVFHLLIGFFLLHLLKVLSSAYRLVWSVIGRNVPEFMHNPEASTSLADFWGHRWNKMVQDTLSREIYRPLRKSGYSRVLAILATFSGSGVIHVIPLVFGQGGVFWKDILLVHGYFLLHGFLVILEDRFFPLPTKSDAKVQNEGSMLLRRIWTLGCVVVFSPMLLTPYHTTITG